MDAALSIFLQVLDRVTGPFLSFGSTLSLTSLACALVIAVALIALRRRRRQRRIRLRVIMRALFPRRITFHASTGIDISYVIFNTFIFGAMFGWALFSFRAISNGTIGVLTSASARRPRLRFPNLPRVRFSPWCCFSHMNFAIGCITICVTGCRSCGNSTRCITRRMC